MAQIDRGSAVTIEVTFFRKPPFSTSVLFDPISPTVKVTDPNGTVKVNDVPLNKSSTGKYYYIFQTTSSDPLGNYKVEAKGSDGQYQDVKVNPLAFELV